MRSIFLGLIVLCEIIIYLTRGVEINEESLRFTTTLVLVVLAAFAISAVLQNFKSIRMSRNYTVSGIAGVIIGIIYYNWVGEHLIALVEWLHNYGLLILLFLIFLSALVLFWTSPSSATSKAESKAPAPKSNEGEKEASGIEP